MKKTVLNYNNTDTRKQPMFLGEPLGLQRYDRLKYPVFYKMAVEQEGLFWRAEEISLSKDRGDYQELTDAERFVFDTNLKWQTATDALLNRSINKMMEYVSLPELEACLSVWSFFESNIHSRSYSHILKNVYPDETEFWDAILKDEEIIHRMDNIKQEYDELFEDDNKDIKTKIFNATVHTNVTESVAFYVSFACSFFFGVKGVMEGNAKIIKLIERDERIHAGVTTRILKNMRDYEDEGFQKIYNENKIIESFRIATENEKKWASYLFSHGNLLGLQPEHLGAFAEFRCNERLKALGIKPIYDTQKANPLGSWYSQFTNSESVQAAPQETEITNYKIGQRNTEVDVSELRRKIVL